MFVDVQGRNQRVTFKSVNDFVTRNGLRKGWVALQWGVSPFQMSALCNPDRQYRFRLNDIQWQTIANATGIPVDRLRATYGDTD